MNVRVGKKNKVTTAAAAKFTMSKRCRPKRDRVRSHSAC